jgi:hypothetical protein
MIFPPLAEKGDDGVGELAEGYRVEASRHIVSPAGRVS